MRWLLCPAVLLAILAGCGDTSGNGGPDAAYRDEMVDLLVSLDSYAAAHAPGFVLVAQNGQELLTGDGEPGGAVNGAYRDALDGQAREDLYFGYLADNEPTPPSEAAWMEAFLDLAESEGLEVLVTDYCWTASYVDSSYAWSEERGYISFAADSRELDGIPGYPAQPWNANGSPVGGLGDARNFLYLINDAQFSSAEEMVSALAATRYDLLIVDLFCCGEQLSAAQVSQLRAKPSGAERLVLCYMCIGEAEDYRWYWQPEWEADPPVWLGPENPDWPGNYLVAYWDAQWQAILYGDPDSYLDRIMEAGFDGAYLDKVDAFEDWED